MAGHDGKGGKHRGKKDAKKEPEKPAKAVGKAKVPDRPLGIKVTKGDLDAVPREGIVLGDGKKK
jgi:hypothetical protein